MYKPFMVKSELNSCHVRLLLRVQSCVRCNTVLKLAISKRHKLHGGQPCYAVRVCMSTVDIITELTKILSDLESTKATTHSLRNRVTKGNLC